MYNLENAPSGRIKGITQALGISAALSHRDIVSESHKKHNGVNPLHDRDRK